MKNTPFGVVRTTGLKQQSTVLVYKNEREARKYFSYILHDNHGYSKRSAQQSASTLEIDDTFVVGDTTYWLTSVADTREV